MDPLERYRRYLLSFGIAEPGPRLRRLDGDAGGALAAFAYLAEEGPRYRAVATPEGLVRSGRHPEDDWRGLLATAADGPAVAALFAFLEEEEAPPGSFAAAPWQVLGDPPGAAGAAPPRLEREGGLLRWQASFRPGGGPPIRVTVTAPPFGPAAIVAEEEPAAGGFEVEREAAWRQAAARGENAVWPEAAALLARPDTAAGRRRRAAAALAELAPPEEAAGPLAAALQADPDASVRRACARELGRLGEAASLELAWTAEADELVRAEIVHALAAAGPPGRPALARVAAADPDPGLRDLARHYHAAGDPGARP